MKLVVLSSLVKSKFKVNSHFLQFQGPRIRAQGMLNVKILGSIMNESIQWKNCVHFCHLLADGSCRVWLTGEGFKKSSIDISKAMFSYFGFLFAFRLTFIIFLHKYSSVLPLQHVTCSDTRCYEHADIDKKGTDSNFAHCT